MEPELRFEKIEALLHAMAERENQMEIRFNHRMDRAERRHEAAEKRIEAAENGATSSITNYKLRDGW